MKRAAQHPLITSAPAVTSTGRGDFAVVAAAGTAVVTGAATVVSTAAGVETGAVNWNVSLVYMSSCPGWLRASERDFDAAASCTLPVPVKLKTVDLVLVLTTCPEYIPASYRAISNFPSAAGLWTKT